MWPSQETEKANVTAGAGRLPEGVAVAPDGGLYGTGNPGWCPAVARFPGESTDVTIPDAHRGLITDVVITPDGQTIVFQWGRWPNSTLGPHRQPPG